MTNNTPTEQADREAYKRWLNGRNEKEVSYLPPFNIWLAALQYERARLMKLVEEWDKHGSAWYAAELRAALGETK